MKTKKLIELLQLNDPTGELECCVDNIDIFDVYAEPAYWDGPLELLERDWNNEFYNVIGGKFTTKGTKVTISTLSIKQALFHHESHPKCNAEFPVEIDFTYVNPKGAETYKNKINEWRKKAANWKARKIKNRIDNE